MCHGNGKLRVNVCHRPNSGPDSPQNISLYYLRSLLWTHLGTRWIWQWTPIVWTMQLRNRSRDHGEPVSIQSVFSTLFSSDTNFFAPKKECRNMRIYDITSYTTRRVLYIKYMKHAVLIDRFITSASHWVMMARHIRCSWRHVRDVRSTLHAQIIADETN